MMHTYCEELWGRGNTASDYNDSCNTATRLSNLSIARSMIEAKHPVEAISKETGLSIEEIEKLKSEGRVI